MRHDQHVVGVDPERLQDGAAHIRRRNGHDRRPPDRARHHAIEIRMPTAPEVLGIPEVLQVVHGQHDRPPTDERSGATTVMDDVGRPRTDRQPRVLGHDPGRPPITPQRHRNHRVARRQRRVGIDERRLAVDRGFDRAVGRQTGQLTDQVLLGATDSPRHHPRQVDSDLQRPGGRNRAHGATSR